MARKSKFSDAQIIGAIKEVEAGATAKDVARKMGVSTGVGFSSVRLETRSSCLHGSRTPCSRRCS